MSAGLEHQARRLVGSASAKPIKRTESPGLIAYGIRDFLAAEFPPREPLIEPIITKKSLAMVHAWRGVGKTHFIIHMCAAGITGTPFFRYPVPHPLNVVLIDGEMPAGALQERVASQLAMTGKEPLGELRILSYDLQENGLPNLADPDQQPLLDPFLEGMDLIIVDNLATLARGGKENDADSWQHVQAWALRQRAAGRSVVFVHHAGKGGLQRGTSAKEDVLDVVIQLKTPSDHEPDQGARFEVHFQKNRGFHGKDAEPFECHLTEGAEGQRWDWINFVDSIERQIEALREMDPKITQAEIAREVGCHRSSVGRAMARMGLK